MPTIRVEEAVGTVLCHDVTRIVRAVSGNALTLSEPREGKVNLIASCDDMCKIDAELLFQVNMIEEVTVFDLILPTLLTGERVTRPMLVRLGMGGLCLNCPTCHYPNCSFGTGA
jgi:hypothetical protein